MKILFNLILLVALTGMTACSKDSSSGGNNESVNTRPVASVGDNRYAVKGTTVTLDGSGSTDADLDTLTYTWNIVSQPAGSMQVLDITDPIHPTFTAEKEGKYIIQLIVNDGSIDSLPVTVMITVKESLAFITVWNTTNPGQTGSDQVEFLMIGSNLTIDWGDSIVEENISNLVTHTYPTGGIYTTKITGDLHSVQLFVSDPQKLLAVSNWGAIEWTSMTSAFMNCSNMEINATDTPDLSNVNDMSFMFQGATSFNQDISDWNVSTVTNMDSMFSGAQAFNQDIADWNVSNVTNMLQMFRDAVAFDQNISDWNVSNVTNMEGMFLDATAFNHNIANWDVSKVTDMFYMFQGATSFNQDISDWNVSNVTNMGQMFDGATAFDQNIANWDVSSVSDMSSMFHMAEAFNQDIGDWNVSNVVSMSAMFYFDKVFNQDISRWNVSKVTDMSNMFNEAYQFDQNISDWNVSNVTNMEQMFADAYQFDQNIGNWDVSKVINMSSMFMDIQLSTINYDSLLIGWDALSLENNVSFGAGISKYTSGGAAEAARTNIINNHSWIITDGGSI